MWTTSWSRTSESAFAAAPVADAPKAEDDLARIEGIGRRSPRR